MSAVRFWKTAFVLCGVALAQAMVLSAAPALPTINTNNVLVITNAPYNAIGDGVATNTTAIQNAINAATLGGLTNGLRGGVVRLPPGTFLCGPLTLKASVKLQLDAGATLKMLPYGQYPTNGSPPDFITASSINNIAIGGPGVIEGQGGPWWAAFDASGIARPKAMFAPSNCRTVLVEQVTLQSPPNTHISLRNVCRDVTIQNITINTTSDVISANTDGIDVNATNCLIQNCFISCGDDHIAMGGGSGMIVITNCVFGNGHGLSIGSFTDKGGLINVFASGTSITIASGLSSGIRIKSARDRGGFVRNLNYTDITLTNVQNPIFISSYYPDSSIPSNPITDSGAAITATTPIYRDMTISNVIAIAASGRNAGRIYGLPEMAMTNLTLSQVTVTADKSFELFHVRQSRFIDTQVNVPGGVDAFRVYNVDLTLTNSLFRANPVRIGGWSNAIGTNALAFFNATALLSDTNVPAGIQSLTLANSRLTVSNDWAMSPSLVMNFVLGSSNAIVSAVSNLTLRGTINLNAGAGFTNGVYTLFTYGKTLTWAAPAIGSAPSGYNYSWDTNTIGQVKLRATLPPSLTPTNILVESSGNQLALSWPADHVGWTLQSNSVGLTATNAWFPCPLSAETNRFIITIIPSESNVFFRMVYP